VKKPLALLALLLLTALRPAAAATAAETLKFGRFGTVKLYRTSPHPKHVVLFLSGDGGWNLGVVDMAQLLAAMDTLVVGINLPGFLKSMEASKEACHYPAADLEMLSQAVQKKLGYPAYETPVVVGYSSGATLAYAAIVQAPSSTFRGALSLGFCPDLPLKKPLCKGQGLTWGPGPQGKGVSFLPAPHVEVPWIVFQGQIDQVCAPNDAVKYVKQVRGAELVMLPKVGHGFAKQERWEPQLRQAFTRIVEAGQPKAAAAVPPPKELEDLPLVEVPAEKPGDTLAVFLSGDGGWADLDRSVAAALAGKGVAVVGLSSLKYFWSARTPEHAAADLARILRAYLAAWKKDKVILAGYSFGADALPALANRLPADLQERVRLVALIAASRTATFEIRVAGWLGIEDDQGEPVLAEARKLQGKRLVCIYSEDEGSDSSCPEIGNLPNARAVALPGGHHFEGRYDLLAGEILK
jgi:type IV secretory pathway VirJ component